MRLISQARRRIVAAVMLCGLFGGGAAALAEIRLQLSTDRERYLAFEPVHLTILLRNHTGNRLVFSPMDEQGYRLVLQVSNVRRVGARNVDVSHLLGGVVFGPGETKQLSVNLENLINLQRECRYTVYAEISHRLTPRAHPSNEVTFEVREGHLVWSRRLGIPRDQNDPDAQIAERDIELFVLHERASQIYCLKISDDEYVYHVIRLGQRIYGTEPEIDTDAVSNIHVLLRLKARLFAYRVFDYRGNRKQERFLTVAGAQAPRLYREAETGRVSVLGGRPATEGIDYRIHPGGRHLTPHTDIR